MYGLDIAGLSIFCNRLFSIKYYFMTLSLNGFSLSFRNLGLYSLSLEGRSRFLVCTLLEGLLT